MRLRKVLSLALALCLLMTLLPLNTFAAAETQTDKQAPQYAFMKDSDHYPKITIQEVTPESAKTPEDSDALWEGQKTYAPTYLSMEEAAVKLRGYMKNRTTTFTLYVKYEGQYVDELMDELLEKATVHTGKPTEGDYLLWHVGEFGGQFTRLERYGYGYVFQIDAEVTYYTTAAQEKELTKAVNSVLNKLNVWYKSDYAKVKAVYDYICNNVTYDYAHLPTPDYELMYTAYAALVNKTAVCQGYATLLYRMLLELGVDCRVITGLAYSGEPHAWNIVKLGNVYYNMDATWDAELDPDQYFLRNSVMNLTHYRYLEYCSTEFHQKYPMSSTDYVEGVAGVPEHVFATGVCGDNAAWSLNWDGLLVISGTGGTYDYYSSSDPSDSAPWAYWNEIVKTVVVEEGITYLGASAFSWDSRTRHITSVTLPQSLTAIGPKAFRDCDALTEIRIPDGVKTIGSSAFDMCDNLKNVILGNSVESIESYAFGECEALTAIQFPESLKYIQTAAFRKCNSLTEITIPGSVVSLNGFSYCENLQVANIAAKYIASHAFYECRNLHTLNLLEGVDCIGSSAFVYCTALTTITIPKSVTLIQSSVFNSCSSVQQLRFEGDAPEFHNDAFSGLTVSVYYPINNKTWTSDVLKNYSGYLVWAPYCPGHQWSEGSCEKPRSCTLCGETTGRDGHVYDDGVDGSCNICGTHRETTEERTVMHMFRMYDPNSGEHFYTGSEAERDFLVSVGWNYEGVGFTFSRTTGMPVYRLYDPLYGEHLYTMDVAEMDALMARGWNLEGVAFNSAYDTEVPQYRLHNPNAKRGAYHFTASEAERDMLIALGWEYQGIGFYSSWK